MARGPGPKDRPPRKETSHQGRDINTEIGRGNWDQGEWKTVLIAGVADCLCMVGHCVTFSGPRPSSGSHGNDVNHSKIKLAKGSGLCRPYERFESCLCHVVLMPTALVAGAGFPLLLPGLLLLASGSWREKKGTTNFQGRKSKPRLTQAKPRPLAPSPGRAPHIFPASPRQHRE